MIGIYKITNLINQKAYIGQSNDIERRFKEHQQKGEISRIPLDIAIQKYGKDMFSYEVIEECDISQLNDKEEYWINYYHTKDNGYNCTNGGNQQSLGENNGRSKLTDVEVQLIRKAYANHKKQRDIYELFSDKISFGYFQNLWQGRSWAHIMPEVFTEENKKYYISENSKGENGASAIFTNQEVIELRTRYIKESAKAIYEDYKERISYSALQQILWGRYYSDLPIYNKKEKRWINT